MIATIPGFDATHANISHLPPGQAAGYITGTPGIAWTSADWAAHPGAVRIDQSPVNTALDELADILDYENGAATLADLAPWRKAAHANYLSGARPGQRDPGIYCSRNNVTPVVNALIAGGVTACPLAVADYDFNFGEAAAAAEVAAASGPFPVIWRQYSDRGAGGLYDLGVFSVPWLGAVSAARPPVPPGQWNDPRAWTWAEVGLVGTGLDGRLHAFALDGGQWVKLT